MSNKKSSWDGFWSDRDAGSGRDVYTVINEAKFNYLKEFIPGSGSSLEVGSGEANLSAHLAKFGYRTTCLDYSEEALRLAGGNYRRQGLKGDFINGSAFELPFPRDQFDLVFSTGLLEHYEDPSPIVLEMVRVLKPGGLFFSDIVPEKFSLLRAFQRWRRPSKGMDVFFERRFTNQEITEMLKGSNLREVKVFAAGVYPPELPLAHRFAAYRWLEQAFVGRTLSWWRRFDDTKIAEWLGFYYVARGVK